MLGRDHGARLCAETWRRRREEAVKTGQLCRGDLERQRAAEEGRVGCELRGSATDSYFVEPWEQRKARRAQGLPPTEIKRAGSLKAASRTIRRRKPKAHQQANMADCERTEIAKKNCDGGLGEQSESIATKQKGRPAGRPSLNGFAGCSPADPKNTGSKARCMNPQMP